MIIMVYSLDDEKRARDLVGSVNVHCSNYCNDVVLCKSIKNIFKKVDDSFRSFIFDPVHFVNDGNAFREFCAFGRGKVLDCIAVMLKD